MTFLSSGLYKFKCALHKFYSRKIIRKFCRTVLDTGIHGNLLLSVLLTCLFSPQIFYLYMWGGCVTQTFEWLALICLCIPCLIIEGILKCHCFYSTKISFHTKSNRKHIGNSAKADSLKSNDRHFEGNDLSQDSISKLNAVITSVKGSQEIKMRSCLYLLGVMLHIARTFQNSMH